MSLCSDRNSAAYKFEGGVGGGTELREAAESIFPKDRNNNTKIVLVTSKLRIRRTVF